VRVGVAAPESPPEVVILVGDESFVDGPGYYYYDVEYPDEGVCGAFATREEAVAHAEEAGYVVRPPEVR
jgi:hypothetical protein